MCLTISDCWVFPFPCKMTGNRNQWKDLCWRPSRPQTCFRPGWAQWRTGFSRGAEGRMALQVQVGQGGAPARTEVQLKSHSHQEALLLPGVRGYLQLKQQQTFEGMRVHPKTKIIHLLFSEYFASFRHCQHSLWVTLDYTCSLLFRKMCCLPVLEPAVCVVLEEKRMKNIQNSVY